MKYLKGIGGAFISFIGTVLTILIAGEYLTINSKRIYVFSTAITANVTLTSAPIGSFAFTTHATGASVIFVSDGTKWQAFLGITAFVAAAAVTDLTVTGQQAGYAYLQNIPAPTTTGAATQLDLNGVADATAMADPVHPKVPRNLVYTITDANTGISAFSITALGKAPDGTTVSETITQAGGLVQTGSKIFAQLTSVTVNSIVGDGAGDTLDVGYGAKIGLSLPAGSTGLSIVKLVTAGTAEAASATDTTNNSFTSTTAPDGTRDFEVWFEYLDPNQVAIIAKTNALLASLRAGGVIEA